MSGEGGATGAITETFVPHTTTADTSQADFDKFIPETYRGKEWVQNILKSESPREEFFKQYESAQSLIGKRPEGLQVPGDNATPEQLKAWHKAVGVPETADAYDLKPVEWSDADKEAGEYLKSQQPESVTKAMKDAALTLGVTPKQLQGLKDAYDKAFVGEHKEWLTEAAKQDADFDKQADQVFGNRKDAVLASGKQLMDALVPAAVRPMLDNASNETLIVVSAVLDAFKDRYIKEDKFNGAGMAAAPSTKADISKEGQRLMALPAYNDPFHVDHERTRQAVRENYEKLKNQR